MSQLPPLNSLTFRGQKRPASSALAPISRPAPVTREASRAITPSHSGIRFKDFQGRGLISQETVDILPFEYCTQVQAETLGPILEGHDMWVHSISAYMG